MERDAPRIIAFALLGSILAVFLFVGLSRHGLVTLACGFAGVLVMIAACAIAGLKVHFLDLIALPITIGIGIDYAVNLAARDRQEGDRGIGHLLRHDRQRRAAVLVHDVRRLRHAAAVGKWWHSGVRTGGAAR